MLNHQRFLCFSFPTGWTIHLTPVLAYDSWDEAPMIFIRYSLRFNGKNYPIYVGIFTICAIYLNMEWISNNGIRHILVGGLEHVLFSIIYGIILPIDELHHFSRWLLHHQPDQDVHIISSFLRHFCWLNPAK